ncbi:MAG: hypothetical protein H6974_01650 [Gammaproteobacteria bacterium]|nr:hypothetical protein [Gammaproteobacteria bacterium]MCP5195491.1 hypothetical protein [Gammaproteobacteria bacterium]
MRHLLRFSPLLMVLPVQAGVLQFQTAIEPNAVCLTHSGDEAAYQISLWSLDSRSHWEQLSLVSGNADYLPPGQTLCAQRCSAPPATPLGRSDPVLILLRDQAGSETAQLAWRKPPRVVETGLRFARVGPQLEIVRPEPGNDILNTQAIAIPYAGIATLAKSLHPMVPPPDPIQHDWRSGEPLILDTGIGQAGAWLLHEYGDGHLELQIAPDGIVRGREQIPNWLASLRAYAFDLASLLGLAGILSLFAGLVRARMQR